MGSITCPRGLQGNPYYIQWTRGPYETTLWKDGHFEPSGPGSVESLLLQWGQRAWGRVGPKGPGWARKGSFPLWFPSSAPLTYKDGTALALSCIADYGAPVFPFLAVGGYQGK